jgi:phage terminase large subunit-like protein
MNPFDILPWTRSRNGWPIFSDATLKVSDAEAQSLMAELKSWQELYRRQQRTKLERYDPYERQRLFHAHGAFARERLLTAGNQCGKTTCGAAEAAIHLTGLYPSWWPGKRFLKPVRAWVGSDGFLAVREAAQRLLVGPPETESEYGTGMIPGTALLGWKRASGSVPNLLDHVTVQHHRNIGTETAPLYVPDGVSTLGFRSYDQGRAKWQGATLDYVWFDEEPPEDVYVEGLSRTNATGGIVWITMTPLQGMTALLKSFYDECGDGS